MIIPEYWKPTTDWDSHRPVLYVAVKNIIGDIYEFGCGYGSTSLLLNSGSKFYSFETNPEWASKFPKTEVVTSYDSIPLCKIAILFVDCAPGEIRKDLIAKWANHASVIVVHDTELGAEYVYGMNEILSSFMYRADFSPQGMPQTTIVSNTINITEWLSQISF